ncbi:amino acid adenylation domain-containing protein [Actinokineospora sp. 24-640]
MDVHAGPPVHEVIAGLAREHPDRIAVVCGDEQVDHARLDARVGGLASLLHGRGVGHGSVVMVCLDRSISSVVALLAIFRLGAAYLPVDPRTPGARVETFVKETGCAAVVAEPEHAPRFAALPVTVVSPVGSSPAAAAATSVQPTDAAYIIYTSGSGGAPKGVIVNHGSLRYLCVAMRERLRLRCDDRVLQFAALSFDTSLEQILVTLTSGATLVLPDMTWAPSELPAKVVRHGISVMDLTPAYWRGFLAALERDPVPLPVRLVIVGGEAVRAEDCRASLRLMPGARLVNAYGLTETTITSCTMDLTADVLPERGNVPVGTPLPGTTVHVVDEDLRPLGAGQRGEVCVGGPGVARGYIVDELPGHERFVPSPFATEPGARAYRTGDLGFLSPEGNLTVLGRVDRQTKVRGFRVEPGEIETVLATHPAVKDAVVLVRDHGGERHLVGYIATATPGEAPPSAGLRRFAAEHLPAHLLPSAFVVVESMPLTPNGKVDTAALPEPHWTADIEHVESPQETAIDRGIAAIWRQVLGVGAVGPQANFFELGGNSILAAELMAKVRISFGVHINQIRPLIRLLLDDATLRSFTKAVQAARRGTLDGDDTRKKVDFAAEAAVGVPITSGSTADWQDPRHVLLTGASGFLGAYLLRELLGSTDAVVHCLVRARDGAHAMRRVQENTAHYFGDGLDGHRAAGRLVAVPGDLTKPLLGLSEEDFDALARTVDVIHHAGGMVNFIYPYAHLSPANVAGTREVIRLAGRHRNIPVHYTSTMAVVSGFGTAGVKHVTEDTPLGHPEHLSVGYVESKWVAEALLRNAAREGLPVAVYRAADISGDCVSGAWNTSTEMCAMKKFIVDSGLAPIAELPLDYTPVDRFAAAVAHIARTGLPEGEVYHLTNSDKGYIGDLAERLRASGRPVREVSWQKWVDAMVDMAVEHPEHPMTPFAPLFIDRCAAGTMSVAEMYLETTFPEFTQANVTAALRGTGIEVPPVDTAMLDRYIRYLDAVGFL